GVVDLSAMVEPVEGEAREQAADDARGAQKDQAHELVDAAAGFFVGVPIDEDGGYGVEEREHKTVQAERRDEPDGAGIGGHEHEPQKLNRQAQQQGVAQTPTFENGAGGEQQEHFGDLADGHGGHQLTVAEPELLQV